MNFYNLKTILAMITASKTREEISNEYHIHPKTFKRWLTRAGIKLPSGNITPKYQRLIYDTFGYPPQKEKM